MLSHKNNVGYDKQFSWFQSSKIQFLIKRNKEIDGFSNGDFFQKFLGRERLGKKAIGNLWKSIEIYEHLKNISRKSMKIKKKKLKEINENLKKVYRNLKKFKKPKEK